LDYDIGSIQLLRLLEGGNRLRIALLKQKSTTKVIVGLITRGPQTQRFPCGFLRGGSLRRLFIARQDSFGAELAQEISGHGVR
jgi:hypothetical protein